jgi:hypothetical protein
MAGPTKAEEGPRVMVARWNTYFLTKKSQFGKIFEGLVMEDVGIFYDLLSILQPFGKLYLVNCVANWYILLSFGTFFQFFGILYQNDNLATLRPRCTAF